MSLFPGNERAEEKVVSDAEKIEASAESVASKVYASKKLAKFFELEVNLRIFGQLVWSWKFPPKN